MTSAWKKTSHPAKLEELLPDGRVRCHLSPRNCTLRDGQHGFCGVRMNRDGRLVSLNYGKSVHATEETIETEAVNHFAPGERILSLGNIGCMLNCSYCHNWKTSQAKYVSDSDVHLYTPEEVVDLARRHGIRVLSWTYNDPVVWHEFVIDTARLARQAGLLNLYKSAFYITPDAVDELLPVIDIFSISIKAIDEDYYRKYTTGHLQPVLDATRRVFEAGKHLEVSTLMITDVSDDDASARKVAQWILTDLDAKVPCHFVRFHPDYRMRDTVRTPVPRLIRAREIAQEMGIEHVYLGNVYDTPYTNTFCAGCDALLISRYGLNAHTIGLSDKGECRVCGRDAHVKLLPAAPPLPMHDDLPTPDFAVQSFDWRGDIRSAHIQVANEGCASTAVLERRRTLSAGPAAWRAVALAPGESYRFIIAKSSTDELGADIAIPEGVHSSLHEVFDRAHFPTVSIETGGVAPSDVTPLPEFSGVTQATVSLLSALPSHQPPK